MFVIVALYENPSGKIIQYIYKSTVSRVVSNKRSSFADKAKNGS